jgi:hypothetical protein
MMRLLPLLLAVVLLAGCREPITAPEPLVPPDPAPPAQSEMYVKGPDTIAIGESASFRAELLHEAATYRWGFDGGGVSTDPTAAREFTVRAVSPGWALVYFSAFDAAGERIGYAEKRVLLH